MKWLRFCAWPVLLLTGLFTGAALAQDTTTYAAFQPYENGYMLWREDTGAVYVFTNAGHQLRVFEQSAYENLPDNPVDEPTPDFRIRPESGFGRVWGNFDAVRFGLGWALEPETGYTASFASTTPTAGGLSQTRVNFPGGLDIVIREDDTWGFYGIPRNISSLPVTASFPATMQPYEHGYMMWWSETGSIWVLYNGGAARLFNSVDYGGLPDNTEQAPEDFVTPALGFGKVWANYSAPTPDDVGLGLGWATDVEQAFTLEFERVAPTSGGVAFHVNLGTAGDIIIRDNGTWYFK